MVGFPKYESYKDSGNSWIEEIPTNWNIERAKWLFKRMDRRVRKEDEVVTAFRDGEVTLRKNRREEGFTNALQEHGYQGIRKGDLVIHAMDAFAGAIGVSDSDGKSTPVYSVCTTRSEFYVNSYYYAYLLRYMARSGFIQSLAKGIRERSTDFRFNDFANLFLPIPSSEEQNRIVNFLDRKTAEIDQAIAQKQRLIELLQEQKAILINQAVTKGLDPNVLMCDRGVEWIGEIPAHWKLVQNRRFLSKLGQGSSPAIVNSGEDEGFYVLKISAVKQGVYIDGEIKTIPRKTFVSDYQVKKGDFLMTRGNTPDLVADICYVNINVTENTMISDLIYRLTYDQKFVLHEFMAYFFRSSTARYQVKICARGSSHTMVKVSQDHIKSWLILVPPLNEQREIISYLKCREDEFFCLENQIHKEIEKLNELKAIFVAQAVTGKIKV